jgi:hypothetical protein
MDAIKQAVSGAAKTAARSGVENVVNQQLGNLINRKSKR